MGTYLHCFHALSLIAGTAVAVLLKMFENRLVENRIKHARFDNQLS